MTSQRLTIHLALFTSYFMCIVFAHEHIHVRVKRKSGDRPLPGQCLAFNRGGSSRLHYYACCNNINDTDSSCDGRTYHRASSASYCNSGGTDNGHGVIVSSFACGGCTGQSNVANTCKPSKWLDIPGTCFLFTSCFEKHCKRLYSHQGSGLNLQVVDPSSSMPESCYNGVCDDGETTDNCPADCCFKLNPSQCTWVNNDKCIPKFCDTPSCSANGGEGVFSTVSTYIIGIFVLGLAIMCLYLGSNKITYFCFRCLSICKKLSYHGVTNACREPSHYV
ncbi:uncharacterized protein [Haliotis cracherodii]|uniref:uncharacterized protein n=1 Tax=Haliotis cracherodii TaxID=6455 RepID=UPI0039E9571F